MKLNKKAEAARRAQDTVRRLLEDRQALFSEFDVIEQQAAEAHIALQLRQAVTTENDPLFPESPRLIALRALMAFNEAQSLRHSAFSAKLLDVEVTIRAAIQTLEEALSAGGEVNSAALELLRTWKNTDERTLEWWERVYQAACGSLVES